ncbi:hypothetical protein TrCOL_g4719 [Triparma columacea]|uniref:DJ-1/PfpI domain-containing protein n=1 Tax=Triparma columacea TaxID=722753 RepID=A0A9W7LGJ9_9STRA|nr:hypothetical protein TrCOL_g4719 [Triparma columacea]
MSNTPTSTQPKVLVPIANGSEEIETSCITDVLTRFGATVTTASCNPDESLTCTMSRGLKVLADQTITQAQTTTYDAIALPGGMPGAEVLKSSPVLKSMLLEQNNAGKTIAAVCASPAVVLAAHGILPPGSTCYPAPAFKELVEGYDGESRVVVKGNVVTSQGPGTSLDFALKIGGVLFGEEEEERIRKELLA